MENQSKKLKLDDRFQENLPISNTASRPLVGDVTATCRLAGGPLNWDDQLSLSSALIYGGVAITICTEAEEGVKEDEGGCEKWRAGEKRTDRQSLMNYPGGLFIL